MYSSDAYIPMPSNLGALCYIMCRMILNTFYQVPHNPWVTLSQDGWIGTMGVYVFG